MMIGSRIRHNSSMRDVVVKMLLLSCLIVFTPNAEASKLFSDLPRITGGYCTNFQNCMRSFKCKHTRSPHLGDEEIECEMETVNIIKPDLEKIERERLKDKKKFETAEGKKDLESFIERSRKETAEREERHKELRTRMPGNVYRRTADEFLKPYWERALKSNDPKVHFELIMASYELQKVCHVAVSRKTIKFKKEGDNLWVNRNDESYCGGKTVNILKGKTVQKRGKERLVWDFFSETIILNPEDSSICKKLKGKTIKYATYHEKGVFNMSGCRYIQLGHEHNRAFY